MNQKKMKPFQELNLLDRFLFDNVMEDPAICQDVLSICLGEEIPQIIQTQKEKTMELSTELRGIRLDIFSFDEEKTIYNTEMQQNNTYNLRKRSRYYQAHMDVSLLEPGEINFNKLNNSYMVMIMPFDLFGGNKYRYTFRYMCEEDNQIQLKDGAVKIFLNTRGINKEEVSQELIDFLHFVEDSSKLPKQAEGNERLKRIHAKVHQVKKNEELGVRYMQEWEEKKIIELKGREEGIIEGKQEGKIEGKLEVAENLIGILEPEVIAEKTGLTLEQVLALMNK